ncbi:DUF4381 domain-containing protein [Lysobacter capsici]|uniref:DUF4381 domain-containing protein n=1 Tax=Lysobacter capsici TaxID=435897 RepID=UPI00398D2B4C
MSAPLALRDVHNTLAPSWWPLAPGWWMVIGALALIAVALYALRRWRERRRRRMNEVFDRALAAAATPAAEVAAMSELLRRAARGFGAREVLAGARCVVAEAEVALAMRDLGARRDCSRRPRLRSRRATIAPMPCRRV